MPVEVSLRRIGPMGYVGDPGSGVSVLGEALLGGANQLVAGLFSASIGTFGCTGVLDEAGGTVDGVDSVGHRYSFGSSGDQAGSAWRWTSGARGWSGETLAGR